MRPNCCSASLGIVALHSVTTTNALHYAYLTSGDDQTRRLLLLQSAAFLPMFRQAMEGAGPLQEGASIGWNRSRLSGDGSQAVEEIFAEIGQDRQAAVGKTLAFLQGKGSAQDFMDGAPPRFCSRATIPTTTSSAWRPWKTTTSISPAWRNRYLAATVLQFAARKERQPAGRSDPIRRQGMRSGRSILEPVRKSDFHRECRKVGTRPRAPCTHGRGRRPADQFR